MSYRLSDDNTIAIILPGLHILPYGKGMVLLPGMSRPTEVIIRSVDHVAFSEVPDTHIADAGYDSRVHAAAYMGVHAPYDCILSALVSIVKVERPPSLQ